MPRLFIAIDIPERIKDDIMATYSAIPGARWVEESQLHITLRFIGEAPGDIAGRIDAALRLVAASPFPLVMKGVGFFPPRKEPRILWVGLAESEELLRVQSRIERAVISAGIDPDERKFHPHITVARLNGGSPAKAADYITSNSLFISEQFSVSSFQLYSSILNKQGAHHTIEASYPLKNEESAVNGHFRI